VAAAELSGRVWSVEIVGELAGQAEANLRQLGCSDVAIRIGDGSRGWREHAPYDRALLTAAAERLPPAILDQIKPGGRIVLPLGLDEAQRLTVVDKGADGQTSVRQLIPVRFSRLETVVKAQLPSRSAAQARSHAVCRRTVREDRLITSRDPGYLVQRHGGVPLAAQLHVRGD
jgi:protein-L-isoaspartate(D-aspartate) O-methyltransferase